MLETWKHHLIQQNKSTSTKCQWQQHKHRVSKGSASTCCLAVVWSKQFIETVSFEGKQQKNVYWPLQKIEFLANKKKYVTGKATEQIDNWKRNIQANFSIFQLSLPNFFTAIPTNPIPQTGLPVLHFAKWPFQRCTLQDDAPLCFTLLWPKATGKGLTAPCKKRGGKLFPGKPRKKDKCWLNRFSLPQVLSTLDRERFGVTVLFGEGLSDWHDYDLTMTCRWINLHPLSPGVLYSHLWTPCDTCKNWRPKIFHLLVGFERMERACGYFLVLPGECQRNLVLCCGFHLWARQVRCQPYSKGVCVGLR